MHIAAIDVQYYSVALWLRKLDSTLVKWNTNQRWKWPAAEPAEVLQSFGLAPVKNFPFLENLL